MNIIGYLGIFLVFTFIVFFHELGHFIFAKRGGILVEEFAIGMGPKIIGFKKGETEYSLRVFPIGGYCKMLGEDGLEEDSPYDAKTVKERAFFNKPAWTRIKTIFGGPLFNFIMAFVFAIIFLSITSINTVEVGSVIKDYPAEEAGLKVGDVLHKIDGRRVYTRAEAVTYINAPGMRKIEVEAYRTNEITGKKEVIVFEMTPKLIEEENRLMIGFGFGIAEKSIGNILKYAVFEVISWIRLVVYSIFGLITGMISFTNISGPVGIVSSFGGSFNNSFADGFLAFIQSVSYTIVMLSANLGMMNLLPLPALDGGRLVFLVIELLRGKPINQEKEGIVHYIGFILLLVLMVVVFFNDIAKLFV